MCIDVPRIVRDSRTTEEEPMEEAAVGMESGGCTAPDAEVAWVEGADWVETSCRRGESAP